MIPLRSRPSHYSELRVALATVAIFVVFDKVAAELGSTRGEAGLVVAAIVLALTVAAEWWLRRRPLASLPSTLGLRVPALRALVFGTLVGMLLLAYFPVFAIATGTSLTVRSDAAFLALGMLAQGGVAEETLFRGFLYRHFREHRRFWPAASLAAVPFVAAHVLLFFSLEFGVALAALLVSVSLTFPLARLFDVAGGSIWPGAIVHAVVQGAIKLVEPASGDSLSLALGWMAVGALAPWAVFLVPMSVRHGPAP